MPPGSKHFTSSVHAATKDGPQSSDAPNRVYKVSRPPVASTPVVPFFHDLGLQSRTLWVMFGRPGLRALEGIWFSLVGKKRQACGDEEKMEPNVHVLRFEIKVMRQTLKYTKNQHQNGR
jgi:hypothetical protein